MENCGFGWQNRVLDAALVASAQSDALPVDNLRNPSGAASLGWRCPRNTAVLTLTLPQAETFRVFSLHRTNCMPTATLAISAALGADMVWSGQTQGCINGQIVLVAPAEMRADTVTFTLTDQDNTDGFLSIPLAYAGPIWQPVRNYSTESTSGRNLGTDSTTSLSGVLFTENRWIQRTLKIAHQSLGDADAGQIEQILRASAAGQNTLFLPVPDAGPESLAQKALLGRLTGDDVSNPFGVADRHSVTLTLTESL
ncbi:hypothetical protein [Acetobacter sp. LMG 32666]|uniref:hypothetical protein n=1 Tax=Acetobacter sp. LMG 32666 TaxID=2959295 RepID=UPI0030C82C9D